MSLPRALDIVTQADIEILVKSRQAEGLQLDFKRQLPQTWNNENTRKFLCDIIAFANSSGGDLIYGIADDGKGRADSIVPIAGENEHELFQRFENMCRDRIDPPLFGVEKKAVAIQTDSGSGQVFVLRIPQSWAGPHRELVTKDFYVREGPHNRQLETPAIKGLFLRSDSHGQRLKNFRDQRLAKLLTGQGPCKLKDGPGIVVHLVPTQSLLGTVQIDPLRYPKHSVIRVMTGGSHPRRLNIDGVLAVDDGIGLGEALAFTQIFRDGYLESARIFTWTNGEVPSTTCEENLIGMLQFWRKELAAQGFGTELVVLVSLFMVEHVRLTVAEGFRRRLIDNIGLFDRGVIVLPDVVAPGDISAGRALRPVFDLIWQAAGYEASINYDAEGEWGVR